MARTATCCTQGVTAVGWSAACADGAASGEDAAAAVAFDCSLLVGGPPLLISRQGCDNQRYTETGARLVAGCIPIRPRPGGGAGPDGFEVLMITSRSGKGWAIPKGGWELDETVEAAAQRETLEEAGVRGSLLPKKVGVFSFESKKLARLTRSHQGRCVAHIFVLSVVEELPQWPEHLERRRRWVSLPEAPSCCRHGWMRDAINQWATSQGWELPHGPAPESESISL